MEDEPRGLRGYLAGLNDGPGGTSMGRDPARIDGVLEEVRRVWAGQPDLRLGQLVCNAARVHTGRPDPFDMEDDELVAALRASGRWQR